LSAKIGHSLLQQVNRLKCRNRELTAQLDEAVEQVMDSDVELLAVIMCHLGCFASPGLLLGL